MERDFADENGKGYVIDISTHTLTWSVTGKTYSVCKQEIDFNSHAHVERDDQYNVIQVQMIISTHTLTWSVTRTI